MAFKRKRSDSETYLSPSSTATFPSREPSSSPCPDISMFDDAPFAEQPIHCPEIPPPYLNSRTRKRFRDNRPDESEIHASTYQRLFSAARSPPRTEHSAPSQNVHTAPSPPQRQSSLHSFWPIPSSTPAVSEPMMTESSPVISCEDCEAPLRTQDSDICMDGMNGGDMDGANFACRSCSRRVCGTCAVVEVGEGRECLQCRTSTRKKWVGGIGWML